MPISPTVDHDLIRYVAEDTRHQLVRMDTELHEAAQGVRASFCDTPCKFPQNWCNYASCVLGLRLARLLKRSDIDLCRWDGDGAFESHYWLRMGDVDIDITADQFGDGFPEVHVQDRSDKHAKRFPKPRICPLLARPLCTASFERALLELDLALSERTKRIDTGIVVDHFLRSCSGVSDG